MTASKQQQRQPPRTKLPPVETSPDGPDFSFKPVLPFNFRAEGEGMGTRPGITNAEPLQLPGRIQILEHPRLPPG